MHDQESPEDDATLTVFRLAAHTGREDPIEIYVDGQHCGEVSDGDFTELRCRPGTHDVVVRQCGYSSQTVTLALPPGGEHELVCCINEPRNRFTRLTMALILGITVFAGLYGAVPSLQPFIKEYEKYWGPVFMLTIGVAVMGMFHDMGARRRALLSRNPGAYLDLTEAEPAVSEEGIRSEEMNDLVSGE
jgi:hypothetical protein